MTPLAVGAVIGLLAVGGTYGALLLHRLGPALSSRPRLGIAAWTSATTVWLLATLAVGPLLAWTVSGPGLPGALGATCQRCVSAANPFGSPTWSSQVPTAVFLAAPVALLAVVLVSAAREHAVTRRATRERLATLHAVGSRQHVRGHLTWVLPSADRVAYAMPGRGGVVVSQGTLDHLGENELAAVLAHERAHVDGRHHALLAALRSLHHVLGRIPLVRDAAAAVADYAEMAADDAARRTAGTPALAGALLALRGHGTSVTDGSLALHAGQHQPLSRVRRLAAPAARAPVGGLVALAAYLAVLGGAVVLVVAPYAATGLDGTC